MGRVPSNSEERGGPSVFVPPTFATGCHFRCTLWEASSASADLQAEFKGEGNKSGEGKHGWSDNWRRRMDGGIKGRGSASAPHEDPSNFSAVVLPKYIKHRPVSLGV